MKENRDSKIGHNLLILRGEMSQEELADKMRTLGYKWSKATVWSIEKGERPLRLTEAEDVMKILDPSSAGLWPLTSDLDYASMDRTLINLKDKINELFDIWQEVEDMRTSIAATASVLKEDNALGSIEPHVKEELFFSRPEMILGEFLTRTLNNARVANGKDKLPTSIDKYYKAMNTPSEEDKRNEELGLLRKLDPTIPTIAFGNPEESEKIFDETLLKTTSSSSSSSSDESDADAMLKSFTESNGKQDKFGTVAYEDENKDLESRGGDGR